MRIITLLKNVFLVHYPIIIKSCINPPFYNRLYPLPALDLKNKSGGCEGSLDRPDIHSKDPEHVTHLQKIRVTPGYDPGTSSPDKDGVDRGFGSFTETAVNDFQEKNRNLRNLSVIWEFNKITHPAQQHPQPHILP